LNFQQWLLQILHNRLRQGTEERLCMFGEGEKISATEGFFDLFYN
jgi:hypothetical protein